MTKTLIYWISRLDSIRTFIDDTLCILLLGLIISTVVYGISRIIMCCTESHNNDNYTNPDWKVAKNISSRVKPWMILTISLLFFLMGIKAFVPTTKELTAIYVIPEIATEQNIEKLKSINANMLDVASTWLKNQTILDTVEADNQRK